MRVIVQILLVIDIALPRLLAQGVEARTRHFRVATTLGAAAASVAAQDLERHHAQLTALGFTFSASLTEVLLFPGLSEMQPYSSGRSVGYFQPGAETAFLVVAWNAAGDPLRALGHEYAHLAMQPWAGKHPLWLREGLADLLSQIRPAEGGLKIGLPIAGYIEALRKGRLLEWQQVLSASRGSPLFEGPDTGPLFYAQSWLLAHRLVVGKIFSGSLAQRLEALAGEAPLLLPIPEVLPEEALPAAAPASSVAGASVRELAVWEWEHRLAELLRSGNRQGEARPALVALAARFPDRPEPSESLGALEIDRLEYDQAERWLSEAIRLGSGHAATHYRYSLLLMRPVAGGDARGRAEQAARHARRAVEIDPRQPLYWLARAHAQMQLSQWESARASLAGLRERAADPLLREQAEVELREIERRREQQARPPRRPAPPVAVIVDTPPPAPTVSPPPAPAIRQARPETHPGTLTFWGYLRRVECLEEGKILTVSNRRLSVRVRERAGQPARLHSPPGKWRAIPCTLKDVEVNLVYRPSPHFGLVNGDLVALIF